MTERRASSLMGGRALTPACLNHGRVRQRGERLLQGRRATPSEVFSPRGRKSSADFGSDRDQREHGKVVHPDAHPRARRHAIADPAPGGQTDALNKSSGVASPPSRTRLSATLASLLMTHVDQPNLVIHYRFARGRTCNQSTPWIINWFHLVRATQFDSISEDIQ
jgi:hypothetical protein